MHFLLIHVNANNAIFHRRYVRKITCHTGETVSTFCGHKGDVTSLSNFVEDQVILSSSKTGELLFWNHVSDCRYRVKCILMTRS